jgi:hypothetical protein
MISYNIMISYIENYTIRIDDYGGFLEKGKTNLRRAKQVWGSNVMDYNKKGIDLPELPNQWTERYSW